jgi:hypothetical protein
MQPRRETEEPDPENSRIVVQKRARTLLLYGEDRLERAYPVALGRNWAVDKAVEGDEATPLGEFYICAKNPRSKYFRSLCISYPNAEDAERGLAAGLIDREQHAQILAAIRRHAAHLARRRDLHPWTRHRRAPLRSQGLDTRVHRLGQSRDARTIRPGADRYAGPHRGMKPYPQRKRRAR